MPGESGGDAAAEFFGFAAFAFGFDHLAFGGAGALGFLAAGFGRVGLALADCGGAFGFEMGEEAVEGELAIAGLGAAVRGRDGEAGGEMAEGAGGADFVNVLAAGAAGAGK